jgi:hypothetical protein
MPSFLNCLPTSYTRSSPPITSCFRYNSGAIRMNISRPRSLWCVMNGFAVAPPFDKLRGNNSKSDNQNIAFDVIEKRAVSYLR